MQGIEIGLIIVGIAFACIFAVAVGATIAARARKTVVCPADGHQATVRCRAADGIRGVFAWKEPCIAACDRWPERAGCPQGCAAQLTAAPTVESVPEGYRPLEAAGARRSRSAAS